MAGFMDGYGPDKYGINYTDPADSMSFSTVKQAAEQNPGSSGFMSNLPTGQQYNLENPTWTDKWFGGVDKHGNKHGGLAGGLFGIAKSGMDVWMGLKQLGLAEDNLDFQKNAFSKQFSNQASLVNTQLRDRQRARVDRNSNAQSVDSYMDKNAVSLG